MPVAAPELNKARTSLDAHVREIVQWHFSPETGCPFWLQWAEKAGWDPRQEVQTYDDLDKFGFFQDEWLRGGPVRRWVPRAYQDKPDATTWGGQNVFDVYTKSDGTALDGSKYKDW